MKAIQILCICLVMGFAASCKNEGKDTTTDENNMDTMKEQTMPEENMDTIPNDTLRSAQLP